MRSLSGTYKTEAVVLRSIRLGEADRVVDVVLGAPPPAAVPQASTSVRCE